MYKVLHGLMIDLEQTLNAAAAEGYTEVCYFDFRDMWTGLGEFFLIVRNPEGRNEL